MINQVILIGNLGDDVKLHYFEDGKCIGQFPLATSKSWIKKDTGEKMTKTSWHNVKVSNKLAENCEKYIGKGSKVFVQGEINYREWEDTDGNKRYQTEIIARELKFLDPPKGDSTPQPRTETTSSRANSGGKPVNGPMPTPPLEEEDDLPF